MFIIVICHRLKQTAEGLYLGDDVLKHHAASSHVAQRPFERFHITPLLNEHVLQMYT